MSDQNALISLYRLFYQPIYVALSSAKKSKLEEGSLFITLMNKTENKLIELLEKYSVNKNILSSEVSQQLLENKWVRGSTRPDYLQITAQGIWVIESTTTQYNEDEVRISIDKLLRYIDEKKFKIKFGKKLTEEERVVLFTLIALRSFYDKTVLHRDKVDKILIVDALNEVKELLKYFNVLSSKYELTTPKSGEDTVTYIFRRAGEIPGKTRNLFKIGARSNYLDLYDEKSKTVSIENTGYLLWKIFSRELSYDEEERVVAFCDDFVNKYLNDIYTEEMVNSFVFLDSKYKSVIKDAIRLIPEQIDYWEKLDSQ